MAQVGAHSTLTAGTIVEMMMRETIWWVAAIHLTPLRELYGVTPPFDQWLQKTGSGHSLAIIK
jgi:hypothetical protein